LQRTANRNANDQAAAQGQIGRFGLGAKAPDLSNPFAGAKFGAPSEQFTPAGLRALDGTRDKMRSLRTEVSAGVAAMRGMVAAGAQNTVAFAALEARTAAAASSYHRLKDQVDFYANGLKTAQREQANYNRTATGAQNAYRAGNASSPAGPRGRLAGAGADPDRRRRVAAVLRQGRRGGPQERGVVDQGHRRQHREHPRRQVRDLRVQRRAGADARRRGQGRRPAPRPP
jgi:hypothetical protein